MHAPFALETAPASQRSTAVYPFAAVKPDGWEETAAAYDEQNELHVAVLELLFDLILWSRASVKTGSCDSSTDSVLHRQTRPVTRPIGELCKVRQQRSSGRILLHQGRGKAEILARSRGAESRVHRGIASCHEAESRGTASCHEAWGLGLSKVTQTMSKKKAQAHDWLSISRGAR